MKIEDELMDLAVGGGDDEVEEVEIIRTRKPDPELVEKRTTTTTTEVRRGPRAEEVEVVPDDEL